MCPRRDRIVPAPRQAGHVLSATGTTPAPAHPPHVSRRTSAMLFSVPRTASSKLSDSDAWRSAPSTPTSAARPTVS